MDVFVLKDDKHDYGGVTMRVPGYGTWRSAYFRLVIVTRFLLTSSNLEAIKTQRIFLRTFPYRSVWKVKLERITFGDATPPTVSRGTVCLSPVRLQPVLL